MRRNQLCDRFVGFASQAKSGRDPQLMMPAGRSDWQISSLENLVTITCRSSQRLICKRSVKPPFIKNVSRLFSDRYLNDSSLQFPTTGHFALGGFVMVKTIPSFTFCWSPRSPVPVSYASSKLN